MATTSIGGRGYRPAQRTTLALFLAHGTLPMDSREVMLTNVLPLSLWLPETDWQVEEVTPFERGR
jgi:hypothetical protein